MANSWSHVARHIRVPAGFVFAAVYLFLAQPSGLSIAIGAVIALAGVALRAWASGHIRKNAELTTTGPYAYTRNPLYLGSIILVCGFAIAARSWWVVLTILVLFVVIYLPVIHAEEDALRLRFPDFEAYTGQVPRLLPRFRARASRTGSFSWERYRQHREYNAAIGAAVMIAALVAKLLWR